MLHIDPYKIKHVAQSLGNGRVIEGDPGSEAHLALMDFFPEFSGIFHKVLAHHRRRVVHFNVTEHPTAAWTARQIVQALPWDTAPGYLIRDRDSVYGEDFGQRVRAMGILEVLTAPRSPWQNA